MTAEDLLSRYTGNDQKSRRAVQLLALIEAHRFFEEAKSGSEDAVKILKERIGSLTAQVVRDTQP